ncbi:MAG: LysM peptidoglycan-binding domain-containing protein [Clostridia bacterium]|nr:LysM peptidoglycan-binding domain-containing protein [Clostridia bacterium]
MDMKELDLNEMAMVAGGSDSDRKSFFYTVEKGDTLNRIATRYNVSVDDLVRWNRIPNQRLLIVGQRLKIYK